MTRDQRTRREFCAQACQAVGLATVAGSLGANLMACGGSGGSPTGPSSASALPVIGASASGGAIVLTIGSSSPLAAVGRAALVQSSAGSLLVARTAQDAFTALTATCTHQACTITGFGSADYVCPCHGSQFSTSGQVLNGPATRALQQFQTQFTNDVLTITL